MAEDKNKVLEVIQSLNIDEFVKEKQDLQKRKHDNAQMSEYLAKERLEIDRRLMVVNSIISAHNAMTPSAVVRLLQSNPDKQYQDLNILDAVTQILNKFKEPLHINTIVQVLRHGGMEFRAEDPTDSVEVTIKKETDIFERTAPRTYKLKE